MIPSEQRRSKVRLSPDEEQKRTNPSRLRNAQVGQFVENEAELSRTGKGAETVARKPLAERTNTVLSKAVSNDAHATDEPPVDTKAMAGLM